MKFALLIFVCLLFAGCFNPGDCLVSATNYLHIQFKKKSNHAIDTLVSFSYYSIFVSGTDSLLRVRPSTATLLLPLDVSKNVTTFIFHRISPDSTAIATDTLQLGYNRQGKVISPDCGAFTYYQNLKVLKSNLPSTQINMISTSLVRDPTISDISAYAVNFQLFY